MPGAHRLHGEMGGQRAAAAADARVVADEGVRVNCTGSPSHAIAVSHVEDPSVVTHTGVPFVVPVNALGGGRVQAQAGDRGGIRLVDCARAKVASSSTSTLALPFGGDRWSFHIARNAAAAANTQR